MFIQIAPRAKVYVTDLDVEFIKQNYTKPFKGSSLSKENATRAKMLADKSEAVSPPGQSKFHLVIEKTNLS